MENDEYNRNFFDNGFVHIYFSVWLRGLQIWGHVTGFSSIV